MSTFAVAFSRTIVVEVDVEDGASLDDIRDSAWQEFGGRALLHSDFEIAEIAETESV